MVINYIFGIITIILLFILCFKLVDYEYKNLHKNDN